MQACTSTSATIPWATHIGRHRRDVIREPLTVPGAVPAEKKAPAPAPQPTQTPEKEPVPAGR
jgi:hypothetical protein